MPLQPFSPLHSGQATAIKMPVTAAQLVATFSPLHSGQATAIGCIGGARPDTQGLSVPSIRGKPLQCDIAYLQRLLKEGFQSPPFGASHCNDGWSHWSRFWYRLSVPSIRGKPLQWQPELLLTSPRRSFSPLHSGQATAIMLLWMRGHTRLLFQSPPFGASHCNNGWIDRPRFWYRLSVPSIRGKPLQCQLFEAECTGNTAFSPLHSGQA